MNEPSTLRLWLAPGLLGLHLFAIAAVAACVVGGLWQLGSYDSRQDDEAAGGQVAVPIEQVWGVGQGFPSDLRHRAVTATGEFAPAAEQLWVDGPGTGGDAWLVAPFLVAGSDAALLVVRGVADAPGEPGPVPTGPQELSLFLEPSEGGGGALDADRVTSAITVPALLNELPHRLWSGYATSATDTAAALPLPPEPPAEVSWTVGLKNLAYAVQWWVFAAFAVFMWWRMCTDQVAAARAAAQQQRAEQEQMA